ncbi:TrbI/VirB10 family protein [Massilia sp. Leaf139]|uniref:TrbI/VirB10 family protein n=1 Tax=Massilia sp. Leaf139 TaxID=1736272 RepID=UPI0006F3CD61|nr:TrbI/VirB10 family protein [Massilia sp. Leaf139]KQQ96109.1 hypothetical protein ASF77_21635 [Massilia sp. Leaf139]
MNLFTRQQPEPDLDDESSVNGERDITPVNKGVRLQNSLTNWAIIGSCCLFAGLGLYKYYAGMYQKYDEKAAPPVDQSRTVSVKLPPLVVPPPEPVPPAAPAPSMPPMTPPASQGAPAVAGGQPPVKTQAQLLMERRLKPGLRFTPDAGRGGGGPADSLQLASAGTVSDAAAAIGTPAQPGAFKASRAYLLPDPSMIMPKGTVIPCIVRPAIDTTLPGIVDCIVAEDVRGADQKVPLLDAGTICTGEQGGGIARGQKRVGMIWSRCRGPAPGHVMIDLDSPAADSLGRIGIPGQVNNHFWDRFGAAIALSLISDVGPYLVATRQGGGNNNTTIAFPNLAGPQEVMTEVLRSTINIPPTITVPQGAQVLIYLNQDLDFRDVYELKRAR